MELASTHDYKQGDNGDVVATDSQKNTVLVFARKNTVRGLDYLVKCIYSQEEGGAILPKNGVSCMLSWCLALCRLAV